MTMAKDEEEEEKDRGGRRGVKKATASCWSTDWILGCSWPNNTTNAGT